MHHLNDKLSRPQLRIVTHFVGGRLHHPSPHAVCLQTLHDRLGSMLASPGGQVSVQAVLVLQTALQRGIRRLCGPGRMAHGVTEGLPFLLGEDGNGTPAVVALTGIGAMGGGRTV